MRAFIRKLLYAIIRLGTDILCRIDKQDFLKVPTHGPLILVSNHINSLEVPLLLAHLQPRQIIGLAKIETWDSKLMGWLFDLWEAIPVRRGEADLDAIRRCLEVLKVGNMLAMAPEGTRSYNGCLLRGLPGIVVIALHSGASILPIAHWGGESFSANLKGFARTDFHVRVGRQFTLDTNNEKLNRKNRQEMVDEIMEQVALLMPEEYRGAYTDIKPAIKYLHFSNI
jgi:1-acyl-sn-glycerol-3-phosphate acyltransferase